MSAAATLAVDSRCELAEGILWCGRREVYFWTDILSSCLWMHRPHDGLTRHWALPDRLGCLALCRSGKLLLGLAKGLYAADVRVDSEEPPLLVRLLDVEKDEPRTRINDGRCDRDGNFVFGTLNEDRARAPIGSFYQYSQTHGLRRLGLPGVAIPNSLCLSLDGTMLYYTDSMQPRIYCCDYEAAAARVANPRLFAELPADGSCADGSTVDAEGHLWNAQWGASRVVRYSPQGEIDATVSLPVTQPSCVTFGGARRDELWITTAREGLSGAHPAERPGSGGLYRWISGVRGLPESEFADGDTFKRTI